MRKEDLIPLTAPRLSGAGIINLFKATKMDGYKQGGGAGLRPT